MIDLRPNFKHVEWRPMPHSGGVPVASDWTDKAKDDPVFGLYKNCGFWTMAEAGILFACAQHFRGTWIDIGAHTGWTAAHIAAASTGNCVIALDPMFSVPEFLERAQSNVAACGLSDRIEFRAQRSEQFQWRGATTVAGVCIDGDHDPPWPKHDAVLASVVLGDQGVVLFHDSLGGPVKEGVNYLQSIGYKTVEHGTVHGVTVCWRGDDTFVPPKAMGR